MMKHAAMFVAFCVLWIINWFGCLKIAYPPDNHQRVENPFLVRPRDCSPFPKFIFLDLRPLQSTKKTEVSACADTGKVFKIWLPIAGFTAQRGFSRCALFLRFFVATLPAGAFFLPVLCPIMAVCSLLPDLPAIGGCSNLFPAQTGRGAHPIQPLAASGPLLGGFRDDVARHKTQTRPARLNQNSNANSGRCPPQRPPCFAA